MTIFFSILQSVGVLIGLGLLGFCIIARRMMPSNVLGFLSPIVLEIALPSLIFVSIVQNFTLEKFPDWWTVPLWWIGFTLAAIVLTFISSLISKPQTRREFAISLFYQNGIFFPLAIISGLFGKESEYLVLLFLFISFHPALFFSTYRFFFKHDAVQQKGCMDKGSVDWKKIIHPVLIMTLIALAIRLFGVHEKVPGFLISGLSMLGGMALPLIMIILGGNIFVDFQRKGRFETLEIIKFIAVKNFLFPLVFLSVLIIINPPYPMALIIFLQSAVPPITAIPIVTERMGGNSTITNQFIVSSYLALLISVPLMFSFFASYFPAP
ncbi:MAG: AEC family transporter [Desulfamplus sp.]|nr:AEC family transporter [Desulfamplus sp.]